MIKRANLKEAIKAVLLEQHDIYLDEYYDKIEVGDVFSGKAFEKRIDDMRIEGGVVVKVTGKDTFEWQPVYADHLQPAVGRKWWDDKKGDFRQPPVKGHRDDIEIYFEDGSKWIKYRLRQGKKLLDVIGKDQRW